MEGRELIVFYGMLFKKQLDNYYCNGAFGRYIDELAKRYTTIYLVVPVVYISSEVHINDYNITSSNIVVQEIPEYHGYLSALKQHTLIKKSIKEYSKKWHSVVYIRWPVPFFKYIYNLSIKKSLPVCFHLVGDTKAIVSEGTKYKGVKKFLAVKFADYNSNIMKKLMKITPTLINGSGLRRLYSQQNEFVREIRTSTFSQKEIESSVKDINKDFIKILYVGYLRHEKGLPYLLEAIELLIKRNLNVSLTIIGEGDILDDLKEKTIELEIDEIVNFKGYVPLGEFLFNEYMNHDIFVLPSISEGTPRVLLEAMSKGLAVVATNTGGIPYTIKNEENGLLVPPKDSNQLSKAIFRLIDDNELRKKIILNGFKFAKFNTLESHVEEVYNFINDKCKSNVIERVPKSCSNVKIGRFLLTSIPVHIIMLITALLPNSKPTNRIRGFLLKPFFKSSGKNLQIASGVILNLVGNISVGDNVYIAHNCWLNGTGGIDIENNVVIGPYSVLATTEHPFIDGVVSNNESIAAPIKIGRGAWLASHVVISSGHIIGDGSLIGAGAVVTKNVEPHSMYGGVPAKYIKEVEKNTQT